MRKRQSLSAVATPKQKPTLKVTKVSVQKTGLNSGITGGGYQCC